MIIIDYDFVDEIFEAAISQLFSLLILFTYLEDTGILKWNLTFFFM